VKVRDGVFEDFEKVLPLAHEVHRFSPSPFSDYPINDAAIQRTYVVQMFNPQGFVKVAETDDGEIVGVMVGMVYENQWGLKMAQDLFMMAHGGTRMLLEAFRDWSHERGVAITQITDICNQPGYGEMIKSVGFKSGATTYVRAE